MKKEYIDFICAVHGYLIRTKEIHWNTTCSSEHANTDEFYNELEELEDLFTETCMGLETKHFPIGRLLPMVPNAESFLSMLKEFEKDVLNLLSKLKQRNEAALTNVLEDMLTCTNKYKYKATQK